MQIKYFLFYFLGLLIQEETEFKYAFYLAGWYECYKIVNGSSSYLRHRTKKIFLALTNDKIGFFLHMNKTDMTFRIRGKWIKDRAREVKSI